MYRNGNFDAAEELLLPSYEALHAERGRDDEYRIDALKRIVEMYNLWRKPQEAAQWSANLTKPTGSDPSTSE